MTYSPSLCSTLALSLVLSLGALAPLNAQESKLGAPLSVEVPPGEGRVQVDLLVRTWAKQTGRSAYISPHAGKLSAKLGAGAHRMDRSALFELLADLDVTLVESPTRVRAFSGRELQGKLGAVSKIYTQDDALPGHNAYVSLVYQVKHGGASAIYANLRGIMARDSTRAGNILYMQGPERVVVSDLALKVAYYRDLIRLLDQPSQISSQQVTVYEVPGSLWRGLKTLSAAEAARALAKLRKEKQVTCVDEARTNGKSFSLERTVLNAGGALQLQVRVWAPSTQGKTRLARDLRLTVSLSRDDQKGRGKTSRQIDVEAAAPSQASLVSALLGASADGAHLVVTLTPVP